MKKILLPRKMNFSSYLVLIGIFLMIFQYNITPVTSNIQATAKVVINELYYDPVGNDAGSEWIELYNPSNLPISLANWEIQSAGSSFNTEYTIPTGYIIKPNDFFLIGNDTVGSFSATFDIEVSSFAFQNAGSVADGVRILDASGTVIDTIIYGGSNSNGLVDDNGVTNFTPAPDASEGQSLARSPDGFDADDFTIDIFVLTSPTPTSGGDYDNQAPQIINQNNKTIPEGSLGNYLLWNASDSYPDIYTIKQEGAEISTGSWISSSLINISLDNLNLKIGIHNFTLTVADISGNNASDTVSVTIIDNVFPEINHPSDLTVDQDVSGNYVEWIASDNHTGTYELYKNGTKIVTNTWNSGSPIQYSLDGLSAGYYNFTLVVLDSSGNLVSDTIIVTVNPPVTQTSSQTSSQDKSTTTTLQSVSDKSASTDGFNIIIVFWAMLFGLAGNIIRKRRN